MRGLVYLEWCYARNNLNAIRRSPARLVLWTLYVAMLALLSVGRFAHGRPQQATLAVSHGAAIGIAGGFLVLTGIAIVLGAAGRFAAFRSAAEAVLMSNAGLRPLSIAVWLQLRKSAAGFRSFGAFSYTFLVFAPVHAGFFGTARAFFATILVLAIPQTAALPAFLLARGRARIAVTVAGSLCAAAGGIYAVAGLSGEHLFAPLLRRTHLDVSIFVKGALLAQPAAFVVPLLLLAVFVLVVAWRGNDAIPELYAASNAMLERQRRGRFGQRERRRARRERVRGPVRVPAGSLAILWKDWITLRRAPGGIRAKLLGAGMWIAFGTGAAVATLRFHDRTPLAAFESALGLRIVFWTPIAAADGLAADLAQPLFWLSTGSLRVRLAVWALARAWQTAVSLGCAAAAAALAFGRPLLALCCVPFAALAAYAFKALGIGLYAIFPSPLDAGGPTLLLRLGASIAYLVPGATLAAVAGLLHAGSFGATCAFALALGVQAWLVIELVALRFMERGATLATVSRST